MKHTKIPVIFDENEELSHFFEKSIKFHPIFLKIIKILANFPLTGLIKKLGHFKNIEYF